MPRPRLLTALGACVGLAACGSGGGAPDAELTSPAARALVAELPPAYQGADLANGKLRFTLCRSCHTAIAGGADMTGPNLHGVFGRRVASRPGFVYSDALKAKAWTWDADRLDAWIKSPRDDVPGTRMSFAGIRDDKDRRDLIAYLKVATSTPR